MSNHYHIVLKLAPEQAECWTGLEVIKRWRHLFKGTLLVQKFVNGDILSEPEQQSVEQTIAAYRERTD